jgi:signal peptidase I
MCLQVIGHVLALALDMVSRDKPGEKTRVKEWGDSFLWALVAASVIRTYVFEPFQIPTGSMEKTMLVGDFLFVNKLAYGPKVPVTPLSYPLVHNIVPLVNIKSYTTFEKGTYTRLPGYRKINRNDVVVFNYPSGDTAIVDPRTPNGLMGHDYHGIVNEEARYLFESSEEIQSKVMQMRSLMQERKVSAEQIDSTISEQLYSLFIDSHEKWKNIKPLDPSQLIKMREYFHTSYTYESNRIEGNTLSLQETHLVINEGITIGGKSMREHFEAVNHLEAIELIDDFIKRKINFNAFYFYSTLYI